MKAAIKDKLTLGLTILFGGGVLAVVAPQIVALVMIPIVLFSPHDRVRPSVAHGMEWAIAGVAGLFALVAFAGLCLALGAVGVHFFTRQSGSSASNKPLQPTAGAVGDSLRSDDKPLGGG